MANKIFKEVPWWTDDPNKGFFYSVRSKGMNWKETTTIPIGEVKFASGFDCDFTLQDGLATFINVETNEMAEKRIPGYYQHQINFREEEGNYCYICGTFCGKEGDFRFYLCPQCEGVINSYLYYGDRKPTKE